ncbi:MAG: non-ribosomal peptide synthetase [bacterium]
MVFKSLVEAIRYYKTCTWNGITFISGGKDELFISYANLYNKALSILYSLQQKGLKPGDELVFQLSNNYDFVSVFWACLLGKIIPVPLSIGNNDDNKSKLFNIWKILTNPYLITSKDSLNKSSKDSIAELKRKLIFIEDMENKDKAGKYFSPKGSDIAFIQFSSGSTGDPKGVILTHKNILTNIKAMRKGIKSPDTGDVSLSWMPLTHDMGLIGFHLGPMCHGWDQYLMPTSLFIRNPSLWLSKISEHKITLTSSPNFGYKHVLGHFKERKYKDLDLSSVRVIVNGAEPISVELCNSFLDKLDPFGLKRNTITPAYGLAEASLAVTFSDPDEKIIPVKVDRNKLGVGSKVTKPLKIENKAYFLDVGSPVENCYLRIVDDCNREFSDGFVGHIQIKGDNVTSGYYNNKKATLEAVTVDGWLNTGDLGFLRNNHLVITGRTKDILFINGQNFYSHDLEKIAEDVKGIELGKVAVAGHFNEATNKDEIIVFVLFRGNLEGFIPIALSCKKHFSQQAGISIDRIIPVNNLPKTTSGKLQRYKLIEKYKNGEFDQVLDKIEKMLKGKAALDLSDNAQSEIARKLALIWKQVTHRNAISINDNFFQLGATSIILAQVHAAIEQEYPNKVGITDFFTYPTIAKLSQFIQNGLITEARNSLIEYISLPPEFFKDNHDIEKETRLIFKITSKLNNKILKMVKEGNVFDDDFYLSLLIYLVLQISKNSNIRLQTAFSEENTITTHIFSICGFSDFFALLKFIKKERLKNEKAIRLNARYISKINFEIPEREASILVYNTRLLKDNIKLLALYDILIGLVKESQGPKIIFEYNASRIKRNAIKQLAVRYLSIIETITEQI